MSQILDAFPETKSFACYRYYALIQALETVDGGLDVVKGLLDTCTPSELTTIVNGKTLLNVAAMTGGEAAVGLLEYLVSERKISAGSVDDHGNTALIIGVRYGCKDVVDKLLDLAGDTILNMLNYEGQSAFLVAASQGNEDMVRLLYERGCNWQVCDQEQKTVLHILVENLGERIKQDDVKIVCDRDESASEGTRPTRLTHFLNVFRYLARDGPGKCQKSRFQSSEIFLKFCKRWDSSGETAFQRACELGYLCLVNLMMQSGIDPRDMDHNDNTPLMLAACHGHDHIIEEFSRFYSMIDPSLGNSAWSETDSVTTRNANFEFSKLLRQKNIDDDTVLHIVAKTGHYDTSALLVWHMVSIDIQNDQKKTPLDIAAEYGHQQLCELFTVHSDCVGNTTNSGLPLILGCRY